jgi:hypothetical protein
MNPSRQGDSLHTAARIALGDGLTPDEVRQTVENAISSHEQAAEEGADDLYARYVANGKTVPGFTPISRLAFGHLDAEVQERWSGA